MARERIAGDSHAEDGETVPDGFARAVVDGTSVAPGTVLADRYEIRALIGRGGMGLVFTAHDRVLRTDVAIKVLRNDYAGERQWAERLAREVKLARQIHHPNVCRVFDFEQAEGHVFLVMELAASGTLRDEVASGVVASRPLEARLADARAIAGGLAAIHEAGIIHRDLSPQNVLRMPDGRLVISDFGLAIDVFASGTSVRGGTVAYMAPELARGGPASFAADVWSLGLVLHEVVFGDRPRWRGRGGGELLAPNLGRRLERKERPVLEACRACTRPDPGARPGRGTEVLAALAGRVSRRAWYGRWMRVLRVAASAVILGVAALAAVREARNRKKGRSTATNLPLSLDDVPLIVPEGEPEDWTKKSRVLAEVPEQIRCLRVLPDKRTVRFVWGDPAKPLRAEDIDTVTGRRGPSPLLPNAYAIGCPDLSPDGRRLLYHGRIADGRAFAFLSPNADGRDAQPLIETAEPTMSSDPRWLSDGSAFTYEIDMRRVGVFSISSRHVTPLPGPDPSETESAFQYVGPAGPIVESLLPGAEGAVIAYHSWPSLRLFAKFRTRDSILDMNVRDEAVFYYAILGQPGLPSIVMGDFRQRTATRLGTILGNGIILRYPTAVSSGLTFVSKAARWDVVRRRPNGEYERVTTDGIHTSASRCGRDIVATKIENGRAEVVRMDNSGRVLEHLGRTWAIRSAACSPNGKTWYGGDWDGHGIKLCDGSGCRKIMARFVWGLSVSADGRRILFVGMDERGPLVGTVLADGVGEHIVARTESICQPVWSGNDTAWVSRRSHGRSWWEELSVESGRSTGRQLPGAHDCSDGTPDPLAPPDSDVRVVAAQRSQVRFLSREFLQGLALPTPATEPMKDAASPSSHLEVRNKVAISPGQ